MKMNEPHADGHQRRRAATKASNRWSWNDDNRISYNRHTGSSDNKLLQHGRWHTSTTANPSTMTSGAVRILIVALISFLSGICLTLSVVLYSYHTNGLVLSFAHRSGVPSQQTTSSQIPPFQRLQSPNRQLWRGNSQDQLNHQKDRDSGNVTLIAKALLGQRILVAIAAYDFNQIPHLEEVLASYHDVSVAGPTQVDVVIHVTIPYPVTLIDLWNTRFLSSTFSISLVVKPKSLRLHLVDCHRTLFYERIHDYDLFIYTEDDIRITPTTIATYIYETEKIASILQDIPEYTPADFNVGIVRYEYNFPTNVVMDDNTRHATQNVTRVYWEHSSFQRPVVPNAVDLAKQSPMAAQGYITMTNHHQGMFLATRSLLIAWRDRPKCDFAVVRNRPGKGNQPTEGTQRVWMSSQMLYGGRHCGVTQVFPRAKFGALTVLHLPNKNYRRVGKYRNRTFSDGSEVFVFEQPNSRLLTALDFHLGMLEGLPSSIAQFPYRGITMVDDVNVTPDRTPLLERRMKEYNDYVDRGGILSEDDMHHVALVEGT